MLLRAASLGATSVPHFDDHLEEYIGDGSPALLCLSVFAYSSTITWPEEKLLTVSVSLLPGSIFSLLTQSDGLSHPASEEPGLSPSWLSVLRYSFLARTHPVHPPTICLLGPRKFLVDSQKRPPWISRLICHLPGGSSPPCTPPSVPVCVASLDHYLFQNSSNKLPKLFTVLCVFFCMWVKSAVKTMTILFSLCFSN
ncbi:hypothetical protein ILYODFUR_016936 [Ilyodon furcidens]|uniref:Uncharacterized protein n=1 Tax=Ilyodon furcidens TaxID=33524 RepID=A0ABV0VF53_9TELE